MQHYIALSLKLKEKHESKYKVGQMFNVFRENVLGEHSKQF